MSNDTRGGPDRPPSGDSLPTTRAPGEDAKEADTMLVRFTDDEEFFVCQRVDESGEPLAKVTIDAAKLHLPVEVLRHYLSSIRFRSGRYIRDAVHGSIPIPHRVVGLLETQAMRRLKGVKQLSWVDEVYPSAVHNRFTHSLGAYFLLLRTIGHLLNTAPRGNRLRAMDIDVALAASLLHDIGHYPFSHCIEELYSSHTDLHSHEDNASALLDQGDIRECLERDWRFGASEIASVKRLVAGHDDANPFRVLVSGPFDTDKLDYLGRDAFFAGVPFGRVDIEYLMSNLLLRTSDSKRVEIALRDKGISGLESVLFARYQMYRNVYAHKTVRAAIALFNRLVDEFLKQRRVSSGLSLHEMKDQQLLDHLALEIEASGTAVERDLLKRVTTRRLPKLISNIRKPASSRAEDVRARRKMEGALEFWLNGQSLSLPIMSGDVLIDCTQSRRLNKGFDTNIKVQVGDEVTPLDRDEPIHAQAKSYREQLDAVRLYVRKELRDRLDGLEPVKKGLIAGFTQLVESSDDAHLEWLVKTLKQPNMPRQDE